MSHPRRRYGEPRQQPLFDAIPSTDTGSAFGMDSSSTDNNFIPLSSAGYTTMRSQPAQHHLYSSPPSYLPQRYTTTNLSPPVDQYHLARSPHTSTAEANMDQLYLADQSIHQYSRSDLDLSSHPSLENPGSFDGVLPTSGGAAAYFSLAEQWYPPLQAQSHHQPPFYITSAPASSTSSPPLPTSHPASLFPHGTPCPASSSQLSPLPREHHTAASVASMTDDDGHDTPTSQPSSRDLSEYGIPNADGSWRCAYPGCTSQTTFRRGCDLRKHYNRHRKHLFCRYPECAQSTSGGFSSKKDRDRHEAKHNPGVPCEWPNCRRMFSRVDNMKDHVRRVHRRREF
ncbi:hypothetical protein P170DRAFT_273803 [Aspergillus steynii IBT 23096]|uniref:C2H2-type domain-containing protein n=1 Tax=Aspergillus steynii IBT 23096 TaxID=1392250 RepID=A0A2I2FWY9_9EURO|nr:uncharacterized protein P170DRAFT_273803 [Aspergillus steynii IBT 23096]PLB45150.1 hypothetical protein P170DRAFT_273803 [Aspergillus steynii IBT 23096]